MKKSEMIESGLSHVRSLLVHAGLEGDSAPSLALRAFGEALARGAKKGELEDAYWAVSGACGQARRLAGSLAGEDVAKVQGTALDGAPVLAFVGPGQRLYPGWGRGSRFRPVAGPAAKVRAIRLKQRVAELEAALAAKA
jgi:hypothetical protein